MKRKENTHKNHSKELFNNVRAKALWITVVYLVIGSAYIIISEILTKLLFKESSNLISVSIVKGLIYVLITGIVIYVMICKALKKYKQAKETAEDSNVELSKSNGEYKKLYVDYNNKQMLLESLINSIGDIIFYKDNDLRYVGCNKAFCEFMGKTEEQLLYKTDYQLFDKDIADRIVQNDRKVLAGEKDLRVEKMLQANSKKDKYYETIKTPYYDIEGHCIGLIGVSRDITERKKKEDEIIYLNHHDILTGLYNRLYLEEIYESIDIEDNLPLSVIIGDMNGLKLVNDSLGHAKGDDAIKNVAEILVNCCGDKGVLARSGGDEFIVLLPKIDNKKANTLIKQIKRNCNERMNNTENMFYANISLGCATKKVTEESLESIMQQAEDLMYRQKMFEYRSQNSSIIDAIRKTMQENGYETKERTERITLLSIALGQKMSLSEDELVNLELLSGFHDIGKISVDKRILLKPSKLNESEWKSIQKHPEVGFRITQLSPDLMGISEAILCHHERWDGNGYPQGLKGKQIPILSRIIFVVIAYEAMTRERPFCKAKTLENAKKEILDNAGTQFDPEIARIFVEKVLSQDI